VTCSEALFNQTAAKSLNVKRETSQAWKTLEKSLDPGNTWSSSGKTSLQ